MPAVKHSRRHQHRHFLREWRQHRGLTQEQAAERLEISRTQLSKIESGASPYSQSLLEAAAAAYRCEPADLIMRNPLAQDALWSIADQLKRATPDERAQVQRIVDALLRKAG